jgi:transposase-like protein
MTTPERPACPHCQQPQAVIRAGHNRTGSQRYRCQSCAHYFTPQPHPQGIVSALRTHAVQLYLEGTSLRAIGRLLGVHHQSVANWVAAAATTLPAQVGAPPAGDTIEVDELYSFVGKKTSASIS